MADKPSVQELLESVKDGFDTLQQGVHSIDVPYAKLRLLDDLLWNTIVSLKMG